MNYTYDKDTGLVHVEGLADPINAGPGLSPGIVAGIVKQWVAGIRVKNERAEANGSLKRVLNLKGK